jgi:hypothetical protein
MALMSFLAINYKHKLKKCEKNSLKHEVIYIPDSNSINIENISMLDSLDLKNLKSGKEEMLKHKVVIVGISRDNAKELPSMIRHIEHVGSFFKEYKVVLFENDSKDGTKMILNQWQKNNTKVKIISKDFGNQKRPNHQFLADARNYYLQEIANKEYESYDIVMMVDMDMEKGIDVRGIFDSFSKINEWDAVCSNGIRASLNNAMYDMFAFRNKEFPWTPKQWSYVCEKGDEHDKWRSICEPTKIVKANENWQPSEAVYWNIIVRKGQKIYEVNSPLVSVNSCFGGMAFYKHEFIKDCLYNSVDNDCEHIPFHECIKSTHMGRMVMNPNQIIRYD